VDHMRAIYIRRRDHYALKPIAARTSRRDDSKPIPEAYEGKGPGEEAYSDQGR